MMKSTKFLIPCVSPIILADCKNVLPNIRYFRRQWKCYCIATGIDKAEESIRMSNLLLTMGKEANELILNQLNLTEAEKNNSDLILNALERHFTPTTNVIHMRYLFNQQKQEEHENIDSYLTKVKQLGNTCDFKDHSEVIIRDRFVVGLRDQNLKEELVKDDELTLEKAVAISKGAEANNYFNGGSTPNMNILKQEKVEHEYNQANIKIKYEPINDTTKQTEPRQMDENIIQSTTPTIINANINVEHSRASTTPDNTVSSTGCKISRDINDGSFLCLKTDYDSELYPPIWKIDGNSLLQKYSHFEEDGKTYYKNSAVYTGWTVNNINHYYPVTIKCKSQNRKEHIVEFSKNKGKN